MSVNEFWKKTFANMSLQEKVSLLLELHMEEVITYVSGHKERDKDRDSRSDYKPRYNNYNNGPYEKKDYERKPKWAPKEQITDKQVDKPVEVVPPKKDDQIIS